jgi:hypothetical protein
MLREDLDNNSSSMVSPEQSDLNNGKTTLSKSNPMVEVQTLGSPPLLTQDGGNSSKKMEPSLLTREERLWMLLVVLIMKTKISRSTISTEESTNNGKSFMLINIQKNQ